MAVPTDANTLASIAPGVQASNWRKTVDDLINHLTEQDLPYSSGEIAAFLRTEAKSLKFRVTGIGEHVRDAYWAGTLPEYADGQGGTQAPVQMQYMTTGRGRTPANQPVFVYGPDQLTCDGHDFEVDIPLPPGVSPRPIAASNGGGGTSYPTSYAQPAGSNQPQVTGPAPTTAAIPGPAPTTAAIPGPTAPSGGKALQPINQGSGGLVAKVHTDKRVCVPRSAFEAYLYASGRAMRAGDNVYVSVDNSGVSISLDADPNATKLTLQATRGRLLFANPNTPFVPGTTYTIKVGKTGLTIDF